MPRSRTRTRAKAVTRKRARTQRGGRKLAARKGAKKDKSPPTIDIKDSADVKKALEVLGKHPLVVVFVFANWCPHCHTFMEQWNKYKKTPNRNTPMISVEQTQMNELLPHIKQPDGEPMSVDGFPTVLLSMNREAANGSFTGSATTNVGTVINDPRNEANMASLLQKGPGVVSTNESEEPTSGSTSAEPASSAINASYYSQSIRTGTETGTGTGTGEGTGSSVLSTNVLNAIKAASNNAKAVRRRGSAELSLSPKTAQSNSATPASITNENTSGTFAKPPKGELLRSQGGGGSGGSKLQTGGFSRSDSLYEALKAVGRH